MKKITVLLSVSVTVLLSVSVVFAVTCPECGKDGKKSRVDVEGATSTLMATQQYYDEDGGYHFDDPNTTTHNYKCSRGHTFSSSNTNTSGAWISVGGSNILDDFMFNIADFSQAKNSSTSNSWLTLGEASSQDTILSWDIGEISFYPATSNKVTFTTKGGQFRVIYDCEVDEASKAVLDAIEAAGQNMGYIILDKNDARLLAEQLRRLQEWEKAADEYRTLVKKLGDK